MKKKGTGMASVYLLVVIFFVLTIGLFVFINARTDLLGGNTVEIENGRMVDGKDAWANFVLNSKAEKKSSIKIVFRNGEDKQKAILKYNDGMYTYKDKKGNEYSNKYLLDVTGVHPHTEKNTRMICLADDEYSFADIVTGEAERDKTIKPYTIILSLEATPVEQRAK